jgi:uncharacterized protein YceH (UPF0502 family)
VNSATLAQVKGRLRRLEARRRRLEIQNPNGFSPDLERRVAKIDRELVSLRARLEAHAREAWT